MRTVALAAILIHAASAASAQSGSGRDSVHVRYDRSYPTVRIGDQRWMAENLGAPRFANGDSIPEAKSASEWEEAWEAGRPAWSFYEGNPLYGEAYGRLYNRAAVRDDRRLCPEGWRVPTDRDWKRLEVHLGQLGSEASYWDAEGGGRAMAADRAGVFRGDSRITAGFGLAVRCVSEAESGPVGEKSP